MRFANHSVAISSYLIAITSVAAAGNLSLSGKSLTWNPKTESSPQFIVGIDNAEGMSDLLFGWQLGLQIIPQPGAVGTLQFKAASLPNDYLLAGRSDGLTPPFVGPTDAITVIADSDSTLTGVTVPGTGTNLLQTAFAASPGARGDFAIEVVPDLFRGASWFSSDFSAREFKNVPYAGGPVIFGTVHVLPEPTNVVLLLIGAIAIGCLRVVRTRIG